MVNQACLNFLQLIRQSQISKNNANALLQFIKSLLPVPNTIPSTLNDLLAKLDVINYFDKTTVCINCQNVLTGKQLVCDVCPGDETKHVAHILNTNLTSLLTRVIERLSKTIDDYKKIIATGEYSHYDIPFGKRYQQLLFESNEKNIITLMIHIDGISLVKSTKLKLWLCSASIIEIPSHIRTQRKNIILLSMYIGYTEPNMTLWLSSTLRIIKDLKEKGNRIVSLMYDSSGTSCIVIGRKVSQ